MVDDEQTTDGKPLPALLGRTYAAVGPRSDGRWVSSPDVHPLERQRLAVWSWATPTRALRLSFRSRAHWRSRSTHCSTTIRSKWMFSAWETDRGSPPSRENSRRSCNRQLACVAM